MKNLHHRYNNNNNNDPIIIKINNNSRAGKYLFFFHCLFLMILLVLTSSSLRVTAFHQQPVTTRRSLFIIPTKTKTFTTNRKSIQQQRTRDLSSRLFMSSSKTTTTISMNNNNNDNNKDDNNNNKDTSTTKKLYAGVGDVVRYYDLDGGNIKGETLIGKIMYISKQKVKKKDAPTEWLMELMKLKDVGDGYYAEYGMSDQKKGKTTGILRNLEDISPINATFVQKEYAYRIPFEIIDELPRKRRVPIVITEQYDIDDEYDGKSKIKSQRNKLSPEVIEADILNYNELKIALVTQTAAVASLGLLFIYLTGKGDLIAFSLGSLAGIAYLLFLYAKTDTMGTEDEGFGDSVSIFRFFVPPIAFAIITFYNGTVMKNGVGGLPTFQLFSTVTPNQFIGIVLGFFTYRIPLFARQISEVFKQFDYMDEQDAETTTTTMTRDEVEKKRSSLNDAAAAVTTVLVVSGPEMTDRITLVNQLISNSNGRYKKPPSFSAEGITDCILQDAQQEKNDSMFVVDANVESVQELLNLNTNKNAFINYVGVWITFDTIQTFQSKLNEQEDNNSIMMKDILSDINYGISNIDFFDYTIVCTPDKNNSNEDSSASWLHYDQLKTAAEACYDQKNKYK